MRSYESPPSNRTTLVRMLSCKGTKKALGVNGELSVHRLDEPQLRPKMSGQGLVSRVLPVHTAVRNCTRDEGGPFEAGRGRASNHYKLLSLKAMVVSVAANVGTNPSG